ncbi:pseudouridine synthase [Paucibacter sp. APW11]|uniref:tRNA pseudouridine synthase C n=1 Tax=Roseateles aquae TaxID=3077235 RepID=A0ABU3PDB6_9BURK|nr:pseudouridine synthase [Paucibacter sp. APW11]MDT9000513.1 pseudouridine synthase [Paucibacter sp. APW11]
MSAEAVLDAVADDAALPIVYQDEHLVAIDKPPGLLVHRSGLDAQEERFALQLLRDQLGRPVWPAHRLDKGTSGLLLFALDADTASRLGQCFEQGLANKHYLALVRGWPATAAGQIDHPLARDPELPSRGQVLLEARTDWQCLARYDWPIQPDPRFASARYALMALQPHSGRRHQIRRHLKHIAHPIIGDATHGKGAHNRAVAAHLGLARLWLHALTLELPHPWRAETLRLRTPPGPEWAPLLQGVSVP